MNMTKIAAVMFFFSGFDGSTLFLFVLWIFTNNHYTTMSFYYFAFFTNLFY